MPDKSEEQLTRPDTPTLNAEQQERAQNIRRVAFIGLGGASLVAVLNLALFFQTQAWQMLLVVATQVVALLTLTPTFGELRRGRVDRAASWLMAGIFIAFAAPGLAHKGGSAYFVLGGLVMLLATGWMTLRHKWRIVVAVCAGFAAYYGLIELLGDRLPRYDISQSIALTISAPGLVALMVIMLIWQLVRLYRGIATIRTRLIASFLIVVALPLVVIAAVTTWLNLQNSRQNTGRQLESVATLKVNQVNAWVLNMRNALAIVIADEQATSSAQVLATEPKESASYQNAHDQLASRFQQIDLQMQLFQELFLINANGQVLVSTNPRQEGAFQSEWDYFQNGLKTIYVAPPYLDPSLNEVSIVVARPIVDSSGKSVAVLAGRASMDLLRDVMQQRPGLGNTAETYLVSEDGTLLTGVRLAQSGTTIRSPAISRVLRDKQDWSGVARNYNQTSVIGVYRWLPDLRVALIAEQAESEAFGGTYANLGLIGGVALLSLGLAVIVSLVITRGIANPLANLARTAERIAGGDLDLSVPVAARDEIGTLAQAFNSMTAQLRSLITNLESQVRERTEQLTASAEVGRAVSSILDVPQLLDAVVNLITGHFGYYYTAVFIVDESGRYAVLQEATGEAGRILKERHHQLDLSGVSMVSSAITSGRPRIALHADEERARFANPLLPETRSEIALPLRLGEHVVGALDVQSVQSNAFNEASAAVLQSMADQIAVTLGNARLYGEVQLRARQQESLARIAALAGSTLDVNQLLDQMMAEATRVFGAQVAVILLEDKARQSLIGRYASSEGTAAAAPVEWEIPLNAPNFEQSLFARGGNYFSNQGTEDRNVIPAYRSYMEALKIHNFCGVALRARDQSMGELYVANRPQGFGKNDLDLLQTIAGYAANAIQNAQLFAQTQQLAARERLTRQITDNIRAAVSVQDAMQRAVGELARVLGAVEMVARIGTEQELLAEHSMSGNGGSGAPGGKA